MRVTKRREREMYTVITWRISKQLQHKHKKECSQTRRWEQSTPCVLRHDYWTIISTEISTNYGAAMNEKKRRTHPESRERELAKMRNRMKAKLSDNTQYRQEHRAQMRQYRKSKLQKDEKYRDVHRQKMKIMYNKNPSYHYANKTRAKTRYQHLKCGQCHKVLTDKQKYWLRRSRLLAVSRRRTELYSMHKKWNRSQACHCSVFTSCVIKQNMT